MFFNQMQLYVFDVGHGSCNAIITPNNQLIMIDCGHKVDPEWRPSDWVKEENRVISKLIISHLDEDHVSDLPHICDKCRISFLYWNPFLSVSQIEREKRDNGSPGAGVSKAIELMRDLPYKKDDNNYGIEIIHFFLKPDGTKDLNNLSLVIFIQYGSNSICFPGDLGEDGWKKLLEKDEFRQHLENVNIFIASHHGREDGFCEEVFDSCKPDLIVISDKEIMYGTQEHQMYYKHVNGTGHFHNNRNRKVLTTRTDGTIKFDIYPDGRFKTKSLDLSNNSMQSIWE